MERVSIITLAYNSMKTIFEAIDSVLLQDYPDIEMIIADDCSAEFDEEKIVAYIETRKGQNIVKYQVYQNRENLGTVKNINTAIKRATGELLINLSADDLFFDEHTVSAIVAEFQRTGCDHLVTRRMAFRDDPQVAARMLPNDREIKKIKRFKSPKKEYAAFYLGRFFNMASGSAFSYRKDYIEKMGYFDEAFYLWEDGPFFVKAIAQNGLLHYNYDIVSVRYRLGGMSNGTIPPKFQQDVLTFLKIGLCNEYTKGFLRRFLKKVYFNRTAPYGRVRKRFLSLLKYPDVYLYQIVGRFRK